MKDTIKIFLILLFGIIIFILLSQNSNFKNTVPNINLLSNSQLSKSDEFNLYTFLETKYENILLPKNIIFNQDKSNYICNNLKFISNNEEKNIKIIFKPLFNKEVITKYIFFGNYGIFEIIDNDINNSEVPEIDHLSTDNLDDLNFDINDIINSDITNNNIINNDIINNDTEYFKNKSIKDIFLKNNNVENNNVENNDTENNTTDSIINNIL